jgi:hypothetical protein
MVEQREERKVVRGDRRDESVEVRERREGVRRGKRCVENGDRREET